MIAEIVSVGTELLMGQIADTNAQHLGKVLPELGISHHNRQTVGDNYRRVVEALKLALSRSDVVFTIGGLGPTEDDLTRDAIAEALDSPLQLVPDYAEALRRMFAARNIPWVETQNRQAMRPECAELIDNPNGSAPGLLCVKAEKALIALPGPKGEFIPMVNGPVREWLVRKATGQVIHSRILRICGMGESVVEEAVRDLIHGTNPSVAPYAKPGEVHLRITALAPTMAEADALLDPVQEQIKEALGWHLFCVDDTPLEAACLRELGGRNSTLAVAESVTGGGLGSRITAVAGASKSFLGGFITYTPEAKVTVLGVPREVLEKHGPVSSECAKAMADGARRALGADYALSLTGNAGPTPDVDGKPVGLVYVALAGPDGTEVEEFKFRSRREEVRERSQQAALTLLYRKLVCA